MQFANEWVQACLAGGCATLNSGTFQIKNAAGAEMAALPFSATAFGTPTNANPSVATSAAITADTTYTPGTIALFALRTSTAVNRISGTVSTVAAGTGDLRVSDTVIPGGFDSVSCPGGLTLTLTMAG